MPPNMALLAVTLCSLAAGAGPWTELASPNPALNIEYRKDSIQQVSPSVRRATVRFVSATGKNIPEIGIYSVETELDFYCKQPLEKVLVSRSIAADGSVTATEEVAYPVFSEVAFGSNSYLLWEAVCKVK